MKFHEDGRALAYRLGSQLRLSDDAIDSLLLEIKCVVDRTGSPFVYASFLADLKVDRVRARVLA